MTWLAFFHIAGFTELTASYFESALYEGEVLNTNNARGVRDFHGKESSARNRQRITIAYVYENPNWLVNVSRGGARPYFTKLRILYTMFG